MSMEKLKFFVVEDNASFLEGIILFLEQILNYEVIGSASDIENLLKQKARYYKADIILMEIQLTNINSIITNNKLIWMNHTKQVIAMITFQNVIGLIQLVNAGFKACVYKNRIFNDLHQAIKAVADGRMYYPENPNYEEN